ncbi:ATP-dependent DNA ligase [Angustibacter sp. Root456]|uniref:ATP-dependent DNA ligase n=1 Tax=Angustibacter sp. Root456 TaxID=1736539 RepID=UPI0006FDEEAE|nr:ATP-dependent DNA ligase [Angustibacter sp. Root456]KQX66771.1 ATP-dependent DNA ligase [Angustibacter sp. Root456]
MDLPVMPPVEPMLAKAVKEVPAPDAVEGGVVYEPKWDGFRCLVYRDGDEVELQGRGRKTLTRYFPELAQRLLDQLPARCVVDGEIVVRVGAAGGQRLDWDALAQRIHPADSRVQKLARETPAEFVAFDLLAEGDTSRVDQPFGERRARLEALLGDVSGADGVHLTRVTPDPEVARGWFAEFEGAGLDGVVAKPLAARYQPGKRIMLKIKHSRTAEAVVIGYRRHKSGQGVGSVLLGLYDDAGRLLQVGGASAFTNARRLELVEELNAFAERDESGELVVAQGEKSRFTGDRDVTWVRLRPELVVEVKYDQMESGRFRHAVQILRWRPDRDPRSCTYDQLERPVAYDLDDVLQA